MRENPLAREGVEGFKAQPRRRLEDALGLGGQAYRKRARHGFEVLELSSQVEIEVLVGALSSPSGRDRLDPRERVLKKCLIDEERGEGGIEAFLIGEALRVLEALLGDPQKQTDLFGRIPLAGELRLFLSGQKGGEVGPLRGSAGHPFRLESDERSERSQSNPSRQGGAHPFRSRISHRRRFFASSIWRRSAGKRNCTLSTSVRCVVGSASARKRSYIGSARSYSLSRS